jgi:ParB-like chromosome segregation protein Spo0J
VWQLPLEEIGTAYRRYRLSDPAGQEAMAHSLRRYGQLSPVVVCRRESGIELLDGFKRLEACRAMPERTGLSARLLEVDERGAKAAIYGLNQVGTHLRELEEAWIVFALVREDGLSQAAAASLLGRHKSWVCRRLALLERLCEEGREDLRLGLLSPTMARQLLRLPAGNQAEVLTVVRRESLSAAELSGVVDLLLASATREKEVYVLSDPRRALRQAQGQSPPSWDPRLSPAGNRICKQLVVLLDGLGRMETWLRHRGRADLRGCDRSILAGSFERLGRDAASVAELAEDLASDLETA